MRSSVWVSASTRRALLALWVRRRRHGAPDSEKLVLPESAQAALSATAGAGRAAVCSVKGGHKPPLRVRLDVETLGKHSHSRVKRLNWHSGHVWRRNAIPTSDKQCPTVQTQANSTTSCAQCRWTHLDPRTLSICSKNSCRNSGKTVPMSPRLTVWAQTPLITVLAHFRQFLPQRVAVRGCERQGAIQPPHSRAPT